MSRLRLRISVSLDGFAAGPDQSLEAPLGTGGEALHEWVVQLAAWRGAHGLFDGVGVDLHGLRLARVVPAAGMTHLVFARD